MVPLVTAISKGQVHGGQIDQRFCHCYFTTYAPELRNTELAAHPDLTL